MPKDACDQDMWIDPTEIRFTHDSISPVFSCQRKIVDTYEELKRGFISVHDIPRMTVARMDGEWYTYTGNRRLWVFQKLARRGYIREVRVETTDRCVPSCKITTRNGGTSVEVRRGRDRVESSASGPRFAPASRGPPRAAATPRDVACPVCGDVRFKSGMGAVMHVESGACRGCLGADNARHQIYGFISNNRETRSLLAPMLMDHSGTSFQVSDRPYQCKRCDRNFRQLSQLMQHTQDKHGDAPPRLALGYY